MTPNAQERLGLTPSRSHAIDAIVTAYEDGATAERATIVALAEQYRILALGFDDSDYNNGYCKALAVLIAAIERGEHCAGPEREDAPR